MASGIYCIINNVNQKTYVGSAINLQRRWLYHKWYLKRGTHPNPHLQRASIKYGIEAFQFSVLEEIDNPQSLIINEQKWLDQLRPEYNIRKTASSNLGLKFSEQTRSKMSVSRKGRKMTASNREALLKANLGSQRSEETRRKLSDSSFHKRKVQCPQLHGEENYVIRAAKGSIERFCRVCSRNAQRIYRAKKL